MFGLGKKKRRKMNEEEKKNKSDEEAVPDSVKPEGDVRTMKFIPYGSTTLRLTEIPFAAE